MYGIRLLGLLLLSGTLVQASDASNFSQDVLKKNDPSKTVIAFDVHGVICSFDWGRFAANGAAIVGLGGLIYANTGARWTAAYAAIYGLFGLYLGGKVLWRYLSDGYKPAVGELLFTGDPGIVFKPMFRYFAGMFKPVPEMYELMQELHKLGYKLILASNVCPDSLSDLQKLCPALRECVDGKFCPGSQPQYAADPLAQACAQSVVGVISSESFTPGRKTVFSWVFVMLPAARGSKHQRVTGCPFAASTVANAVPHAPSPNTLMLCFMLQAFFFSDQDSLIGV
jgi:hypothetical protein